MIWPFPTKDANQYRRVDQGWDLQVAPGTPILAVAAGTLSFANDPNGFGNHYPVLTLDVAIDGNPAIYYGHNTSGLLAGTHVNQGDVIAHALQQPGGNAHDLPGWLEIGWWNGGPTGDGQSMHDHLINAPCYQEDDLTADQAAKLEAIFEHVTISDLGPDATGKKESLRWAVQQLLGDVEEIKRHLGITTPG